MHLDDVIYTGIYSHFEQICEEKVVTHKFSAFRENNWLVHMA